MKDLGSGGSCSGRSCTGSEGGCLGTRRGTQSLQNRPTFGLQTPTALAPSRFAGGLGAGSTHRVPRTARLRGPKLSERQISGKFLLPASSPRPHNIISRLPPEEHRKSRFL